MPDHYEETPTETVPVQKKPRTNGKKLTDKQKVDLKKHMEKQKKAGMTLTEQRSHRMKMMQKMRAGKTLNKAHKEVMSS
tara:strand:+ start:2532 stop:2768 length:237 start_codon:yes stop_codon:yes gene_type:complete